MLGKLVIGLASIVLGAKHLHSGVKELQGLTLERKKAKHAAALKRVAIQKKQQRRCLPAPGLSGAKTRPSKGQVKKSDMTMSLHEINGIEDRIKHIQGRISKGKVNPKVYEFTRKATSAKCGDKWCVEEKDNVGEAKAVFEAIRKNVRYTSDILGIDTYQHPKHTLSLGSGDCDDYSSLICATMLSLGIPCRLKVIRTKDANEWNHIYAQAGFPRANPTKWITMDASVPKPFGWEAPASMVAESRVFSAQ